MDTFRWLHNKLGTSNDSWISSSISSQLNQAVLRNIKECFPDLQTQVKLKLLLSFFHITRRSVEEWKTELDEIIEVAALDSELWVSMLAETMKTFPATGSLNTEISDYEETRPIFTDMVNELRKLVSKHSDLGMLPLECQYLNKNALTSVVGQQPNPIKHFTLKRKPKSVNLRTELLQKSADAQSSLKKASAPTIPLRSRGMPRKMTDTTPLKGIPSRVPTSGFRSPTGTPQQRPNVSRTPAGRKDGGIKFIEMNEAPLSFAAQKKRKRQLDLEEQQKKALEQKQNIDPATSPTSVQNKPIVGVIKTEIKSEISADTSETLTTPDYAAGLTSTSVYVTQPPTPAPVTPVKDEPVEKKPLIITVTQNNNILQQQQVQQVPQFNSPPTVTTTIQSNNAPQTQQITLSQAKRKLTEDIIINKVEPMDTIPVTIKQDEIKIEKLEIKDNSTNTSQIKQIRSGNKMVSLPNNISVKITSSPHVQANVSKQATVLMNNSNATSIRLTSPSTIRKQPQQLHHPVIASNSTQTQTTPQVRTIPLSQLPKPGGTPLIISQTIIKPAGQQQPQQQQQRNQIVVSTPNYIQQQSGSIPIQVSGNQQQTQYILTSSAPTTMPSLTSFAQARPIQTIIQASSTTSQPQSSQPTKILIKTAPTIMMQTPTTVQRAPQSNPPPLISTQQSTILQNVSLPNRAVTIQPASQAAQVQHFQAQLQAQQVVQQPQQVQPQQQQQIQTHTVVSNTNATQQPKFTLMSPKNIGSTGKTIYLAQKGVILRNIGGDMYQQIPISNVSGLNNLSGATLVSSNSGSGIVKTTNTLQQVKQTTQQIPALIPTNSQVVIQQGQQTPQQTVQTIIGSPPQQTIIRPVIQGNITTLPQGLTLIQRPGQQPQLVQVSSTTGQQGQRTIITQQQTPQQQQIRPQQIIITSPTNQQRSQIITTQQPQQIQVQRQQVQVQQQQQQQQQNQQPQRKGLSLSNEHVIKAHEMFRKANKVSRPDKALILGFMAGLRDNPRPNPENVINIKLGETEENVKQEDGKYALCLVESLIRLDYNTGEWKTFQNYRRLDQGQSQQQDSSKLQSQTQNTVAI